MNLDLSKKVIIENLCNWKLGFKRINTLGDVSISPKAKIQIDAGEVISQCYANNKLFMGEDGRGSHARILICDKDIRVEVGLESEDSKEKQFLVTDDVLNDLFDLKTLSAFKKRVQEQIVSHAEKNALAEYVSRHNINDYQKIMFVKEYTGFNIESE